MDKPRSIMAVASAGGHWVQLLRLRPAFEGCSVSYITTQASLGYQVSPDRCHIVRDGNMDEKFQLAIMSIQIAFHIITNRPDIVISTGAAPGFMAIVIGKLMGAKTIWLDSIANSEELSLAGKKARRWADHWLTQWPELATPEGPYYIGSVI